MLTSLLPALSKLHLAAALALLAGLLAYNTPALLAPAASWANPLRGAEAYELKPPVALVSDLHVGGDFIPELKQALEEIKPSAVIVVGDLVDEESYFYGKLNCSLEALLSEAGLRGYEVYWVTSMLHDPEMQPGSYGKLHVVGRTGIFKVGSTVIVAHHGETACKVGPLALAISYTLGKLGLELPLEKLWRKLCKVPDSWWVIFGHSHLAGIDPSWRVANTGSWRKLPRIIPHSEKTAIMVDDSGVKLVAFSPEAPRPKALPP
ncbi:MAG: hypothetical protein DRN99_01385 [Thermoproteota archaeon]|nr:MAG: hypothetical protein DRN99_01385 [Candidatus Korarchaeota archaeon]